MANLSDQPVRAARAPSRTVSRRALVVLTTAALAAAAGAAPAGASGGSGRAAGTSPVFPTTSSPAPSNVHRPCQLDEPTTAPPPARPKAPRRDVVAKNIDVPWGMVFLPGGGMLVGGRDTAKVLLVHKNGSRKVVRHMKGVDPNGNEGGEAGLLGLALAPNFKSSHWVYAYMSSSHDNRIVRMRWGHHRLGRQRLVLKGIPRSLHHNGGGLAFGPDGMLYASTGEAEVPSRAQNRRSLGGKILRMTPRGKPAPGNPWRHSVVYSIGHRNVEGIAFDPQGRLWATEFGDHAWDELNLIKKGHNYGWPIVEGRSSRFTQPKAVWHTDQAGPSGIAIVRAHGKTVAFIGGLTGQRLWRVALSGARVTGKRALYTGQLGRIRDVRAHGGYVYFTTSNTDGRATPRRGDDKIIRIKVG
jgi:glucose/arabinose dehydrogenase